MKLKNLQEEQEEERRRRHEERRREEDWLQFKLSLELEKTSG